MKYILQKDFRLRGWKGSPFYLEYIPDRTLRRLTGEEFVFLSRCDGKTEIDPGVRPGEPAWVREGNIIVPCPEGASLLPRQEYRLFPNRRLDYIDLAVTGRCNFNCRHCFNAKDFSPRTVEPGLDQLMDLLAQMDDCGVGRIRINGGEPLVRKDLLSVTAEIARRGMKIGEILTNGYLLTGDFLDALEAQGHRPVWFISFDGLGFHDWLRGVPGAEERALAAIELLCTRGYYVQVHQCVWKDSLASIQPTVLKMRDLGVSRFRLTPVEPSLRWKESAPEQTISTDEWLAYLPGFLTWWYENGIDMDMEVWSYWIHNRGSKRVYILPDLHSISRSDKDFACSTHRDRPFINGDGSLVPCLPLSGHTEALGLRYGNVYEGVRLRDVFTESSFFDQISCTCGELKEKNEQCHTCRWKDRCAMGCRAESLAHSGCELNGVDPRMCVFYHSGAYEKLREIAERFGLDHHCTPI